jgi:hypothetical protein
MAKKVTYRTAFELSRILGQAESNALLHLRKNAATNIVSAVQRFRSDLADIRADVHLTPAGRDFDIAERRKKAKGEIETQQALGASAIELIRTKLASVASPAKSTQEQLLDEMKINSGWQVIQMALASGKDLHTIASQPGQEQSVVMALARYGKSYLESKNTSPRLQEATLAVIHEAQRPFYTEEQQLAADLSDEIEMGATNLSNTAGMANHTVEGDGSNWPKVAGWGQGEVLEVFAAASH